MSKPDLDDIKARWPSDGEWWFRDGTTVKTLIDGGEEVVVAECVSDDGGVRDAEFISHAFRDIYHILAYVEQLESDLKTVQEVARADHDSLMRQRSNLKAHIELARNYLAKRSEQIRVVTTTDPGKANAFRNGYREAVRDFNEALGADYE